MSCALKYARLIMAIINTIIFSFQGVVAPKTSGSPQMRDGWNPPREQIPDFQPLHPDDSGDSSDMDIKHPTL